MAYEVRTGNVGLTESRLYLDPHSHTGETIRFVLDSTLADWQWRLYADGRPVTKVHDITGHVAKDVREAIKRQQAKPTSSGQAPAAPDDKPARNAAGASSVQMERPTMAFEPTDRGQLTFGALLGVTA